MNKERVIALADHIEGLLDDDFCMMDFYFEDRTHECGSPSCIAGWAVWLFDRKNYDRCIPKLGVLGEKSFRETAIDALGVTFSEAQDLFYATTATRQQAVDTLRRLAETGEVDWSSDEIERDMSIRGPYYNPMAW